MKKLQKKDILEIIREEWKLKINKLVEEVELVTKAKINGKEKDIISKGTKVRHKETQILYTIHSISPHAVKLLPPEGGNPVTLNKDVLEKEYELD